MIQQKLSDNDYKTLFSLLKRFAETELDQWERWKFNTKYGYVFVEITRKEDEYPDLWDELQIPE
ncbi:MAG: hypothetical protein KKC46_09875 [Proteobacteria bacterium]|nr:hypothetical protein [Pseudomonadota bacterium]